MASTSKPTKAKSSNPRYWHKHRAKPKIPSLPSEIRLLIYKHVFEDVTMVDVHRTKNNDYRRRFGAHNLLRVSKKVREEALVEFFKTCTFSVHHVRLHEDHRWLNKFNTLGQIRNLHLMWTRPRHERVATKKACEKMLLQSAQLQRVTIDLLGFCLRLPGSTNGAVDLPIHIVSTFEKQATYFLAWMRKFNGRWTLRDFIHRLLRDRYARRKGTQSKLVSELSSKEARDIEPADFTRWWKAQVLGLPPPYSGRGMSKPGMELLKHLVGEQGKIAFGRQVSSVKASRAMGGGCIPKKKASNAKESK